MILLTDINKVYVYISWVCLGFWGDDDFAI